MIALRFSSGSSGAQAFLMLSFDYPKVLLRFILIRPLLSFDLFLGNPLAFFVLPQVLFQLPWLVLRLC